MARAGRSGIRCPQFLWISLCTLPELMRYVRADKVIISVGERFEHNSNNTTPEWTLLLHPSFPPIQRGQ
jgi:hypothetical protein